MCGRKQEYLFDLRVENGIFLMPKSTNNLGEKRDKHITFVPKPEKINHLKYQVQFVAYQKIFQARF